jgi:hypothetical protein
MLILGWDVDQHVFNVDSTLAFQRWICNVDSMLNIDCVEITTLIQRWIYLIYINLYFSTEGSDTICMTSLKNVIWYL